MPAVVVTIGRAIAIGLMKIGASATASIFIAQSTLYLAGTYVLSAASAALQKKPDFGDFQSEAVRRLSSTRGAAAPRRVVYGKQRVGGHLVYVESHGDDNKYLNTVWALAGHECEAIDEVWLDDTLLTFKSGDSGHVSNSSLYYPDTTVSLVFVNKHLGTAAQTVDGDLDGVSSNWTSNHRLRGITYLYIRLHYQQERLNQIPNVTGVVRGKNDIYDFRDASTGYSTNAALCTANYMMDASLGLGIAQNEIDSTTIQASANVCDESVALNPSGTENRYTLNGSFETSVSPKQILEKMLTSMAGKMADPGGVWYIHAGSYTAPTVTLNESHLRSGFQVQTKPSKSDNCNAVQGIYANPDANYQPDDFPAVTNSTYETEDGEQIWRDIELPFTTSSATAQRLAKIELERTRQALQIFFPANMHGYQVQEGDTVAITLARMGWTSKVFLVEEATLVIEPSGDGAIFGCDLLLKETASTVFSWSSGEETTVDPAPNTTLPDPGSVAAPTSLTVTSGTNELIAKSDGTIISRAKLAWTQPVIGFAQRIQVEYKKSADGIWIKLAQIPFQETNFWISDVEDGTSYDFRIASVNGLGVLSSYETVSAHTIVGKTAAPGVPTGFSVTAGVEKILVEATAPSDVDLFRIKVQWDTVNTFDSEPYEFGVAVDRSAEIHYDISRRLISGLLVPLEPGKTIYVRVRSMDTTGNYSAYTSALSVTTLATNIDVPDWRRYGEIGGAADFVYSLNKNFSGVADNGELLVEGTELIRPDGTKYTFKKTSVRTDLEGTTTGIRYIIHLNNSDAATLWPLGSWGSSDDTKVKLIAVKAIGVISGVMNFQAIDDDGDGYTLSPNQSYTLLAKIEKTDSTGGINGLWPLHTGLFTYNYLEMGLDATYGGRVRVYDDDDGTTVLAKYEGAADGGMLELNDDAGSLRAKAYVDSSKRGRLNLYDDLGSNSVVLYSATDGGSLILRDNSLNTQMDHYVDATQGGVSRWYDTSSEVVLIAKAGVNGGFISVYNDAATPAEKIRLYTNPDGGRIVMWDSAASISIDIDAERGAAGVATIALSEYRSYNSSDTDVTGLINGSTFGTLIQGQTSGHVVIGIRGNDSSDSFAIIKDEANATGLGSYDTRLFEIDSTNAFFETEVKIENHSLWVYNGSSVNVGKIDASGWFWSLDSSGYRAVMDPTNGFRVFNTSQVFQGGIDINGEAILNELRLTTPTVPTSNTSAGTTGDISIDSAYLYVCTATNTWKRMALDLTSW